MKKGETLPDEWRVVNFAECILRKHLDVGNAKQNEYTSIGKYPIIDQGQALIAGYWDKDDDVYNGELPVIIFGDHTRIIKYVDFPFVCGADGTKILLPNKSLVDPRFFYFLLSSLDIPNRGYNRHYRLLKDQTLPLPPLPEQQRISYVLSSVQEVKEKSEAVVSALQELKKSMMAHLFKYGPVSLEDAEKILLNETEIGEMPEEWHIKKVCEISKVRSGGTPSRDEPTYWQGDIPWVKTTEIKYSVITTTEEKITKKGLDNSSARIISKGTLLMAMYGQGVTRGRVALLGIDSALNQACAAFVDLQNVDAAFLYYFFTLKYVDLRNLGHGANQRNLNAEIIKSIEVPVPPISVQKRIASILADIDGQIDAEENKKAALKELFKSLLRDLMSAKRRVNNLEF